MLMQKPEFTAAVFLALHPEYLDVFVTFRCDFGSFLSVVLMLMIFMQWSQIWSAQHLLVVDVIIMIMKSPPQRESMSANTDTANSQQTQNSDRKQIETVYLSCQSICCESAHNENCVKIRVQIEFTNMSNNIRITNSKITKKKYNAKWFYSNKIWSKLSKSYFLTQNFFLVW